VPEWQDGQHCFFFNFRHNNSPSLIIVKNKPAYCLEKQEKSAKSHFSGILGSIDNICRYYCFRQFTGNKKHGKSHRGNYRRNGLNSRKRGTDECRRKRSKQHQRAKQGNY